MRAVVMEEFGGPEVLHVGDVPDREPGPGQIRIRVEAVGVNAFDGKVRSGAMEPFFRTRLPAVLGLEAAGVVDRVGPGVDVPLGTRVTGWVRRGYAELALLDLWAVVPDGVDATTAAALPVVTETARRTLRLLDVRPGETLLIHGASGGVGGLAAQLAVASGVSVIGTASPANADRVAALGATPTTYGEGLADRVRALAPSGVDAVLDAAGRGVLPDSIALRGGTDRVLTIADPAADELGVTYTQRSEPSAEDLAEILGRVADGEISVRVAAVIPFERAAEAHRLLDGGHTGGKVVLVP